MSARPPHKAAMHILQAGQTLAGLNAVRGAVERGRRLLAVRAHTRPNSHLRRLDAGAERIRSEPTVLTVSPSALTGVGRAAQPVRFRQGDVSSFQAELVAFRAGEDDPAHAGRLAGLHCGAEADQTSVQPAGRRPAGSGPGGPGSWPPSARCVEVGCSARLIAGAETRCGKPAAQAIPEALSGLYPGVRNRSWSWRRRNPVLPPSMTG